ncbi:uncharacterized protein LOC108442563 isoform X2 [Pygocentrus nattereri]|uniref:uncharacterized protein LOC108442563 isoform X2 n=1 Tax=Pygocentrus nattereri TaxID=42514 RepID=UPI0018917581|nr:uncharacterized protein LOC108442563 isoform X2 [Pygocentrus nattereri]
MCLESLKTTQHKENLSLHFTLQPCTWGDEPLLSFDPVTSPVCMMSTSVRDPPQRRRSLGPVSPKRIYRNLSVRLRGRDTPTEGEGSQGSNHHSKVAANYLSLWEAVESGDVLAVQTLLCKERVSEGGERGAQRERDGVEERERAVNSVNEQGLVPLDVAILTHNSPLLHVLVKAGARHNPNLSRPCDWSAKLDGLVSLAERRVEERRAELKAHGVKLLTQTDTHRELRLWTLRQELYTRMRERFHTMEPPGPPSAVGLQMLTDTALSVSITPPQEHIASLITTYRVEWSTCAGFTPLTGCGFITDTKNHVFHITGLSTGVQYYVRVCAYSIKGWGPPRNSSPPSTTPSSWRQCSSVKIRGNNQEAAMRKLLEQIREPTYRGYCTENPRQLNSAKRMSMSRGLKQFFHSATKFVRLLQRGAYLAVVFYQKDNILVTAEDQLPLVEIQCCSTSITQDFLWFAKLSCAWQQVSWLQQAMSSSLSSSSSLLQNRHCILRAINQLQSSLGSVDLGQVYFEPLKDHQGNVLLVTLREVVTSFTPADPHLHWSSLKHLEARWSRTHLLPEPTAVDTLTQQLRRKLEYHRRSLQRAQPGLYVGILKLCSSVEQLRVLVPQRLPNLLFNTRVRNNTHVSREEWSWLQRHLMGGVVTESPGHEADGLIDNAGVKEFVRDLRTAVTQLLTKLNIPLHRAYQYRLYTQELVQVGDEISLLLLLPPSEEFSSSFWPLEGVLDPGLTMPLHIFELVHFWAYSRDLLSLYCQAWVRLELDAYLAQQALREALDSKEVSESRERLSHITQLSQSVEAVWRERRWIMDVMQCVRSRQRLGAVPLHLIMGSQPIKSPHEEEVEQQLHLSQTHTHVLSTTDTVSSSDTHTHAGATAPVDIPGISEVTENERTHLCMSPSSYLTCTAISQSIPDTHHYGNEPSNHSSGTFHHSGNGIHHIHSCPEFSAFPSSSLSISEEEKEEKEDKEQNLGEETVELLENLNFQEENMELMSDLELVLENKDHTDLYANSVKNTDLESVQAPNQAFFCQNAFRNGDPDSALEDANCAAICASTVRKPDLEAVLLDTHHPTNCTTVVTYTDLESVHSANEIANAIRNVDLKTDHCANAVLNTDLGSAYCTYAFRDTDLKLVHCVNEDRDTDLELVHQANAVGDTDLETVHCANVVRDTDLESVLEVSVCVRTTERAAEEQQVTTRKHELETVCYTYVTRSTDLESIHCANAVINTDLKTAHCANALRDTDLELVHCDNANRHTDLELVHCDNAVTNADLELVCCANTVINMDLGSVHCANTVTDSDQKSVYCANADRDAKIELVHCGNSGRDTDPQSLDCANAVRDTDPESDQCVNAVRDTVLESIQCANAVRGSDPELVCCANAVKDTPPESVQCANAVRDTDPESVCCANAVKDSDLQSVQCANAVRDNDPESDQCVNAVRDTVLESIQCANAVRDTDPESVHYANAVRDSDLESVQCANAVRDTDPESVHYGNAVRDSDLESVQCANAVRDTDPESAHYANAVRDSDLESVQYANANRETDPESAHCANAVRDSDLESVQYANANRDTDPESAHCAYAVRDSDVESVQCVIGETDLESVLEASVYVGGIERSATVPQLTMTGCSLPTRILVEWVTTSSSQEVKQ